MIMSTQRWPVSGRLQCLTSLAPPSLALCSIATTTFLTPATRSIAPPIPLTILPGIIQLAMSPRSWLTCMAPRMHMSMWPPRIIAKESRGGENSWSPSGGRVMVCFPALIRSGSTSASVGKGPDAEKTVLRYGAADVHPRGDMVGHERGHADTEVDDVAVAEFLGGSDGDLVAGPAFRCYC